jgi:uncharacterized protein (DUF1800 family)
MTLDEGATIDRLTLGATAALRADLRAHGAAAWVEAQLAPATEPAALAAQLASIEAVSRDPGALVEPLRGMGGAQRTPQARQQIQQRRRELWLQATHARLLRAAASPWQLRELLVDFWFNHFNVFGGKGPCALWLGAFEEQAIRPHVLGAFEQLLAATAHHPAMLVYLDNRLNSAPGARNGGLNENYARELMELHTVGLVYTQADVSAAAHLLTGWGIDRTARFRFFPRRHDGSAQTVLGHRFSGGESAVDELLVFLARHPATAERLSGKLAQYFVADDPPPALVRHMAGRYRDTGGDLRAVTQAMIEHPDFAAAAARRDKFRTPYRYVTALLRASGRNPAAPAALGGALRQLGQPLYGCVQPNGWACTAAEWLSPDALTARINFAVALGTGALRLDPAAGRDEPVPAQTVAAALGDQLDDAALRAAHEAPPRLAAALLLGSPALHYC